MSDLDELATDVLYLQDGSVQFYKSLEELKEETGEQKLGRAIAQIMSKTVASVKLSEEIKGPKQIVQVLKTCTA
jgi:ABC-type multidrug transport system ATPase subunit